MFNNVKVFACVMGPFDSSRVKIFYSYSYSETGLRSILRDTTLEEDAIPVFADEQIAEGMPIMSNIRRLISSSDLIVIVFTPRSSSSVAYELTFAENLGKPIRILEQRRESDTDQDRGNPFVSITRHKFGDYDEIRRILKGIIRRFKRSFWEKDRVARHVKEREFADKIGSKPSENVLVLGKDSDSESLRVLSRISAEVRTLGYNPLILRELPDVPSQSLEQKMLTAAVNSKFVIADESRPSGVIDELKICAINELVTAILKEAGRGSTWMQFHYPYSFAFMKRFCYYEGQHSSDGLCELVLDNLEVATKEGSQWADSRIAEQTRLFSAYYKQYLH
jgi:hypothetical protein